MLQILHVMAIAILYEDEQILAVSKPSGQVVIPGRGKIPGETLLAELERYAGKKIFVVHRLDLGASGVIVFAKDAPMHRELSLLFERRLVKKTYLVLVQGSVEANGRVDQPLREFGSGRMGIHKDGKAASTDYRVREALRGATLLDVTPQTGRRHQIRVHLYSIGHPVMGDPLYGKDRPVGGLARLMLHASQLEFQTGNGLHLTLSAEPPQDFQAALQLLRSSTI